MASLNACLVHLDDIKVLPGKWQYRDDEPFPPLSEVLKAKIWTDASYQGLREALMRPVADPEVFFGGEFHTINCLGHLPSDTSAAEGTLAQSPEDVTQATQEILPQPTSAPIPKASSGRIHLVPLRAGSHFPKELTNLDHRLIAIQLSDGEDEYGIHNIVLRKWGPKCPLVLAGKHKEVSGICDSLRIALGDAPQHWYDIALHTQEGAVKPYLFSTQRLVIVTQTPLSFRVFIAAMFIFHIYVHCHGNESSEPVYM